MVDARLLGAVFACAGLSGCIVGIGTGVPGGAAVPGGSAPFTDFGSISKPGTTQIKGSTTETSYTASSTFAVTSVGPATNGTGSATISVDSAGNPTALTLTGANSSASFDAAKGDKFYAASGVVVARSANGSQLAGFANPFTSSFNYQTYGVWETGLGSGSGNAGAISVGSSTPNNGVPTSGSATFTGSAGGAYVDPNGANYLAAAPLTANANFGARSLSLSTSGSQKIDPNNLAISAASNLDMNGTLTYAGGTNSFSGTLTTTSGLTGNAVGNFYGPNAQELGGTFGLRGAGVEGYIGGFGAKQ